MGFFDLSADLKSKINALEKSQAVIEFQPDGTILTANKNFLDAVGYSLDEIKGKHHRIFVDPAEQNSPSYAAFWETLRQGKFQSAEYKRFGKDGKEVWIQASYNPLLDKSGKVYKVVKFATDITGQKMVFADLQGQIDAISKAQAVIQFKLDGTVIDANKNFLDTLGYSLDEIKGKHHSMFVEPGYRDSAEYTKFWADLGAGHYQASEYKRLGKGGKEVWIQASYNPIFDLNGKPVKIVKFATDITAQVLARDNERLLKLIAENLHEIDAAVANAASQSNDASRASGITSSNVHAVASGAEELNASVKEIAEGMARSSKAADVAFEKTQAADQATKQLSDAAKSMTGIVEIIQVIAGQINLLSLNATIESARAGEAGRGFAVVANEVKNLAKEASDATEKITREIDNMQSVSGQVVDALGAIRESIGIVREHVASSASAVEEQSAVAQDMSNNMQSAAGAVNDISSNIAIIASATVLANQKTQNIKDAISQSVH